MLETPMNFKNNGEMFQKSEIHTNDVYTGHHELPGAAYGQLQSPPPGLFYVLMVAKLSLFKDLISIYCN